MPGAAKLTGRGWLPHGYHLDTHRHPDGHHWRTTLRLHQALIHLANGWSVTDTATQCGWSNPSSFIDAFTELVGRTPGRYQAGLRY